MERASEVAGAAGEARVGVSDFGGGGVAHETGDGQRQDLGAALVFDEEVDGPRKGFVTGSNGDEVVAIVGDTGCDSAFAHKGHGGRGVGVAVHDGDFKQVAGGIGEGLAILDAGLGFAGACDDLAIEGLDHTHDAAGGGDVEIGGVAFAKDSIAEALVEHGVHTGGAEDMEQRNA